MVVVRSAARAGDVVEAAARLGARPRVVEFDEVAGSVLAGCAVAVSTVPASGAPAVTSLLGRSGPVSGVLLDVVYQPARTPVMAAWEQAGGTVVGGLVMLLHQAVEQVRLFTGRIPSVDGMRAAGLAELARRV
jgi:shikimate dehydrogenase